MLNGWNYEGQQNFNSQTIYIFLMPKIIEKKLKLSKGCYCQKKKNWTLKLKNKLLIIFKQKHSKKQILNILTKTMLERNQDRFVELTRSDRQTDWLTNWPPLWFVWHGHTGAAPLGSDSGHPAAEFTLFS